MARASIGAATPIASATDGAARSAGAAGVVADASARAPQHGFDEARARLVHRQPARLKYVALEKKSCERVSVAQLIRGRLALKFAMQKCRQPQHAVLPRFARIARHGAAGFGRHVDK